MVANSKFATWEGYGKYQKGHCVFRITLGDFLPQHENHEF